jgi:hypothetical protein
MPLTSPWRAPCRLQDRAADLAPEDRHFVAQHDYLDGEIGVTAADESDEPKDAAARPVEEREGHGRLVSAPESRRQGAGRGPWMAFSPPTPASCRTYATIVAWWR